VLYRKGSFEDPMSADELERKFFDLSTKVATRAQAGEIAAAVADIEKLDDVAELMNKLAAATSKT